jgi:hypothetical protein
LHKEALMGRFNYIPFSASLD